MFRKIFFHFSYFFCIKFLQDEEDLDPEDVELDEHYTLETRSKCKDCDVHYFRYFTICVRIIYNNPQGF